MKKKVLALIVVVALVCSLAVAFTACDEDNTITVHEKVNDGVFKIGLICLHGAGSTYDENFINAMEEARVATGLTKEQVSIKENIPEDNTCYETACNLADDGCDVIFADSFGHEAYIKQAAIEYPYVKFCHATGTSEHVTGLSNFHNAFASIYEGRYLAGIAAGMKLNEMAGGVATGDNAKMGYVGAFPYAEVISGFTAFYLGAKSVCPDVTMDVKYTGSWYNETAEKETANYLIGKGARLISQHADSMGAPTACKDAQITIHDGSKIAVPNVTYNVSTKNKECGASYLIGSRINWAPYFTYIINSAKEHHSEIETNYVGTVATKSVELLELNTAVCAAGTQAAIDQAKADLANGKINVFDLTTFTVTGEDGKVVDLSEHKADVDPDDAFTPDTIVIKTNPITGHKYFAESEFRSAPYFDLIIDGITILK